MQCSFFTVQNIMRFRWLWKGELMNFSKRAEETEREIIKNRHYLHEHAELSFKENETTAYLVSQLESIGIPVQTFKDYTGCIATIEGEAGDGPTVLLRADIDALPILEESGVEFASKTPGVMHACGHDCHASMLLGAARLLWEQKKELKGTVKLLFQAAEEAFIGSHYYVDHGYLDDVDAAMGMHVWASGPAGKILVKDGELMASCDNFKITVHGVSTHGSMPHLGKDAIVAASSILLGLQHIASRMNDPLNSLVVTVGKVTAGTQFNIIADTVVMEGTVRCYAKETRAMVEETMRRIVTDTAAADGCTADLEYSYLEPSVVNRDPELTEIVRNAAEKLYGPDAWGEAAKAGGSEDFSYVMDKIPSSVFALISCQDTDGAEPTYPLHNGKFKINESILKRGAALYAQFAADYLEKKGGAER